MKNYPLLFLISVLAWSSSYAQDYAPENLVEVINLKGTLFQRGTKKPMMDTALFLLPAKIKATTDAQGNFEFSNVPKGDCQLIVNAPSHQRLEKDGVCQVSSENLTLYIEKSSYQEFETTVTAKVIKRDSQTQSMTQEQFLTMPGSFGGDPVRATQNLPGVGTAGMSAQVIVQGASPDDTIYLINGHQVPLVFHFGGLSSVIVPEAVERVDLFPSGYGPEYSKAIGGIIELTTREPKKDRLHGMAYIDLFNTGFLFEGPGAGDNDSWMVSGRYAYIGQVLQKVADEEEDFNFSAAPTYYDFSATYANQLNANNKFKSVFLYSRDELRLILSRAGNSDPALRGNFQNRTQYFRLIPSLETKLENNILWKNSVSLGQDLLLVNIGGRYLDIDSRELSQRSEVSKEWSKKHKSYVGLDNNWSWSEVGVNLPKSDTIGGVSSPFSVGEERKFVTRNSDAQLGAYLREELKWDENSPWTLLPNLRLDHFTITSETKLSPRFQARYQWDETLALNGSWGYYYQPPLPQETSRNYGNTNLQSPYAVHWTGGWNKDFDPNSLQGLEIGNNFFYKKLHRLVVPSVSSGYVNDGAGDVKGMEWQIKYRLSEWTGQMVYTYLRSRRTIPGYGEHPSEFDQTHNLNLIGSYQRGKWTYGGRFRYITGSPYTPVSSATFDSDNGVYIPTRGALFSQRFQDFLQLDIRIDRKFVYDTWILTGYLDIQNVTNSSRMATAQYLDYSYDYSQKEEMDGLPILPTLGVKGEF
jgi:hypothetical protein